MAASNQRAVEVVKLYIETKPQVAVIYMMQKKIILHRSKCIDWLKDINRLGRSKIADTTTGEDKDQAEVQRTLKRSRK